jgi:hypothetical protein
LNTSTVLPLSRWLLLPLLCGALLLTACASSQPRMGEPRQPYQLRIEREFHEADKDGDEQLTREEFEAGFPKANVSFEELDTDGNGRLNLAEIMAYVDWRRITLTPMRWWYLR